MFFKGDRRKKIQAVVEHNYSSVTGFKLKWLTGEKERIIKIASMMADFKGEHEDFDAILLSFDEYVSKMTKEWLSWDEGNRNNYIGYLHKTERVKQFSLRDNKENLTTVHDDNDWSDF